MPKNRFYTSMLALSISTILAACGGGGSTGGEQLLKKMVVRLTAHWLVH